MSFFKIAYTLNSQQKPHIRYYRASSKDIALCMFNETIEHGSLVGYSPCILKVSRI